MRSGKKIRSFMKAVGLSHTARKTAEAINMGISQIRIPVGLLFFGGREFSAPWAGRPDLNDFVIVPMMVMERISLRHVSGKYRGAPSVFV